jgi:hypothetical protein
MTTIYLVLEISALLLAIVLPLAGPKKKKNKKVAPIEFSEWAIGEDGSLQKFVKEEHDHHPVR